MSSLLVRVVATFHAFRLSYFFIFLFEKGENLIPTEKIDYTSKATLVQEAPALTLLGLSFNFLRIETLINCLLHNGRSKDDFNCTIFVQYFSNALSVKNLTYNG